MTFDEDYFVDVSAISGSPGVWAIHRVDESHLLVQLWDPETPIDSLTSVDRLGTWVALPFGLALAAWALGRG